MSGLAEMPASMAESVDAIATRLGVPTRDVSLAPQQGLINLTVYLGDDLVLRIPRTEEAGNLLAKEASVIPIVQNHGVSTAGVISYDSSRTLSNNPYIVLERLRGRTLAEVDGATASRDNTHRSLSEILALVHSARMAVDAPIRHVSERPGFSPDRLIGRLSEIGDLGRNQGQWMREWFEHLEACGARSSEPVLLHGDVIPSNIFVDGSGRVTALIDWGNACWGEEARDLADFPTRELPALLGAYRRHRERNGTMNDLVTRGYSLEAGALWFQLCLALARLLGQQSSSEARNWSAPRQARWFEIVRFLSGDVPARWKNLFIGDN